jgi:hypothetical protein
MHTLVYILPLSHTSYKFHHIRIQSQKPKSNKKKSNKLGWLSMPAMSNLGLCVHKGKALGTEFLAVWGLWRSNTLGHQFSNVATPRPLKWYINLWHPIPPKGKILMMSQVWVWWKINKQLILNTWHCNIRIKYTTQPYDFIQVYGSSNQSD